MKQTKLERLHQLLKQVCAEQGYDFVSEEEIETIAKYLQCDPVAPKTSNQAVTLMIGCMIGKLLSNQNKKEGTEPSDEMDKEKDKKPTK
jgi:hypothetical protein